jgi:hypothetical protein
MFAALGLRSPDERDATLGEAFPQSQCVAASFIIIFCRRDRRADFVRLQHRC